VQLLLESGLEIAVDEFSDIYVLEKVSDLVIDKGRRGPHSSIQIDSSNYRFIGIDQDSSLPPAPGLVLAPAEAQEFAKPDPLRQANQACCAHEESFYLAELSLGEIGKSLKDPGADHNPENCIAQELERLVILKPFPFMFIYERAMSQGTQEQLLILKSIPQQ